MVSEPFENFHRSILAFQRGDPTHLHRTAEYYLGSQNGKAYVGLVERSWWKYTSWYRKVHNEAPDEDEVFAARLATIGENALWVQDKRYVLNILSSACPPGSAPVLGAYLEYIRDLLHPKLATALPKSGHVYSLVLRSLRRGDSAALAYVSHSLSALLSHADLGEVLRDVDHLLDQTLRVDGKRTIPRQGIRKYAEMLALHVGAHLLTGSPVKGGKAFSEAVSLLSGQDKPRKEIPYPSLLLHAGLLVNGRPLDVRYALFLRAVARDKEKGFAQNWFEHLKGMPYWAVLGDASVMVEPTLLIKASKERIGEQIRALEEFPTCLHPLGSMGNQGADYIFSGERNNVVPLFLLAYRIRKEGERLAGRMLSFWDFKHGNIYLTSNPIGLTGPSHVPTHAYVRAVRALAENLNGRAGERIIKRIIVGKRGGKRFVLDYPRAHDDYILTRRGRAYVVGEVVEVL